MRNRSTKEKWWGKKLEGDNLKDRPQKQADVWLFLRASTKISLFPKSPE